MSIPCSGRTYHPGLYRAIALTERKRIFLAEGLQSCVCWRRQGIHHSGHGPAIYGVAQDEIKSTIMVYSNIVVARSNIGMLL